MHHHDTIKVIDARRQEATPEKAAWISQEFSIWPCMVSQFIQLFMMGLRIWPAFCISTCTLLLLMMLMLMLLIPIRGRGVPIHGGRGVPCRRPHGVRAHVRDILKASCNQSRT